MYMHALFAQLKLDDITQITPLEFGKEDLGKLRATLLTLGFNLDDLTDAQANSLWEEQFRSFSTGRGPGFVAVLHAKTVEAKERADLFIIATLILAEANQGKRIVSSKTKKPIDGTENRGLMQALADLLSIAVFSYGESTKDYEEFVRRLNRRIWRGLLIACKDNTQREKVNQNFSKYGEPPTAKTASLPLGSLSELWKVIRVVAEMVP